MAMFMIALCNAKNKIIKIGGIAWEKITLEKNLKIS